MGGEASPSHQRCLQGHGLAGGDHGLDLFIPLPQPIIPSRDIPKVDPSDPQIPANSHHSALEPSPAELPPPRGVAALLAVLEEISRTRPDRVLRLRGHLAVDGEGIPIASTPPDDPSGETRDTAGEREGAGGDPGREPFELLLFRGFSSSVTHATAFDPDRPALPEGAVIASAELLAGPLNPLQERRLAAPQPVEAFLSPSAWGGDIH